MYYSDKLITYGEAKLSIVEAYKTLRTNIQFSFPDGNYKTLMVTSSEPAEGKSTTCVNLAIAMAQSGKRVLLVDADLRKSTQYYAFGILNYKGLSDILLENVECVNYMALIQNSGVEKLDILTSGTKPPNPSELLGSQMMEILLEILKSDYDLIIVDTPPVLPFTDAAVLSPLVDGVILVAAYGKVTFEALNQTKECLEKANARILGVVLNRVPTSGREEYYNYYKNNGKERKTRKKSRGDKSKIREMKTSE